MFKHILTALSLQSLAAAFSELAGPIKIGGKPVSMRDEGRMWPEDYRTKGKTYAPNGSRECARRRRQMGAE